MPHAPLDADHVSRRWLGRATHDLPANEASVVRSAGVVMEPEEVADIVAEAIAAERFLILPHPQVHEFMKRKADDPDRWLAGMRKLQSRVLGGT